MRMKCIGGKLDGECHYVHGKIGDSIRLRLPVKLTVNTIPTPKDILEEIVIYRIAVFNFSKDDKYRFLVPECWTDKEAIIHQFNK
jgi:hypothetical protein